MIFYLTLGDQPSGIYRSQVEDLVKFLNSHTGAKVKLVAFVSLRGFFTTRRQIKASISGSIVLPMVPRLKNWRLNRFLLFALCVFQKPQEIIGRNPLATNLAIDCRGRKLTGEVVYDGRGAVWAEWHEYEVVDDVGLKSTIKQIESRAINESDKQIAVTKKLVDYWRREFSFAGSSFQIVPCTLDEEYLKVEISDESLAKGRKLIKAEPEDVVLVYSGSTAGWQSIKELFDFLTDLIKQQDNLKLMFLGKRTKEVQQLIEKFPERVSQNFVKPEEVNKYLVGCDYGLLIREESITNEVAAPVKFAEYLACGLRVISSRKIGDYSELIADDNIGYFSDKLPKNLPAVSLDQKLEVQNYATRHFTKASFIKTYKELLRINIK